VWDLKTGTVERRFDTPHCMTNALAWSRDGARIASGSDNWKAFIWDAHTGRQLSPDLRHSGNVYGVALCDDGSLVTGCADGLVRVWNPDTGQLSAELRGHTEYVHQVAFNHDCTRLATASGDKTLRVWDTTKPADRTRK
jgi:WD40 repeat protein